MTVVPHARLNEILIEISVQFLEMDTSQDKQTPNFQDETLAIKSMYAT